MSLTHSFIHISDGEILRRTTTLSVRPRESEPNGTTESPTRSQFRAPLPACALPLFFCCVDAECAGTDAGLRIPPRCRKY